MTKRQSHTLYKPRFSRFSVLITLALGRIFPFGKTLAFVGTAIFPVDDFPDDLEFVGFATTGFFVDLGNSLTEIGVSFGIAGLLL